MKRSDVLGPQERVPLPVRRTVCEHLAYLIGRILLDQAVSVLGARDSPFPNLVVVDFQKYRRAKRSVLIHQSLPAQSVCAGYADTGGIIGDRCLSEGGSRYLPL